MSDLPLAELIQRPAYNPMLRGKRARHRYLDAYGRLSGEVRGSRGRLWVEVECKSGRWWWLSTNIIALGPIPVPAPGFPRGK